MRLLPSIIIAFFFLFTQMSVMLTQTVLQLEKVNSPSTTKYYVGDILTIKTVDFKKWTQQEILGIYVQEDSILIDSGMIHISQITHIMPAYAINLSNNLKNIFGAFGLTVLVYTLADPLMGRPYNWIAFYAGLTSVGIAGFSKYVLPYILQQKIGRTYRLRLLDLNFYGNLEKP